MIFVFWVQLIVSVINAKIIHTLYDNATDFQFTIAFVGGGISAIVVTLIGLNLEKLIYRR